MVSAGLFKPMKPASQLVNTSRGARVMLTPHAAFYSDEAEMELRRKAAQNLVDWARQGRPTYVTVDPGS